MAGHLREIERGAVYELTACAGRDPVTGKKRQRTRRFHGGRRAAEKALAAFVTEIQQADPGKTEATVGWLIETWLRLQTDAGRAPDTVGRTAPTRGPGSSPCSARSPSPS